MASHFPSQTLKVVSLAPKASRVMKKHRRNYPSSQVCVEGSLLSESELCGRRLDANQLLTDSGVQDQVLVDGPTSYHFEEGVRPEPSATLTWARIFANVRVNQDDMQEMLVAANLPF